MLNDHFFFEDGVEKRHTSAFHPYPDYCLVLVFVISNSLLFKKKNVRAVFTSSIQL